MKKQGNHPKYQEVLFVDSTTGDKIVVGSTLQTDAKEKYKGKEYPVCYVSISSFSHPFYTGSTKLVDSEGRVQKFLRKYSTATNAKENTPSEDKEESKEGKQEAAKKKVAKKKSKK